MSWTHSVIRWLPDFFLSSYHPRLSHSTSACTSLNFICRDCLTASQRSSPSSFVSARLIVPLRSIHQTAFALSCIAAPPSLEARFPTPETRTLALVYPSSSSYRFPASQLQRLDTQAELNETQHCCRLIAGSPRFHNLPIYLPTYHLFELRARNNP